MSGFKLMRIDEENNEKIQKWQKKEEIGHKVNKYTMYLKIDANTQTAVPVQYEMKGFNTLLGSHYDHYYLEYFQYSPDKPDPKVFEDYDDSTCHGFPGPGLKDHTYTMNPMREYISQHRGALIINCFSDCLIFFSLQLCSPFFVVQGHRLPN